MKFAALALDFDGTIARNDVLDPGVREAIADLRTQGIVGMPTGPRARTLREFVAVVEHTPAATLDGHLRRRDFSRWVAEVFGDYQLAKDLQGLEEEYRRGGLIDIPARVSQAVRSRYEFIEPLPESRDSHMPQ